MSRRRSTLPLQRGDLDSESATKECLTQYQHLTSRDILTIQVLDGVSIIYGVTFLTYLLWNANFLHLGKLNSLYIPVIHTIFEYLKLQLQQSKKIRCEALSYKNLLVTCFLVSCVCHCAIVLFGAEIVSNVEETYVFSCILTAIVLIPTYFYYGRDSLDLLMDQKIAYSPLFASMRSVAYGSVMGAWFGAFVIPLDWERNWQKWPIPCVIGSLIGFVLGHAYSLISLI